MKSTEELIEKAEAARILRVGNRTIEKWNSLGMPHFKMGKGRTRYRRTEILGWFEKRNRRGDDPVPTEKHSVIG